MDNTEAWQILVAARAEDITKWLKQQKNVKKALTAEVLNQQTAMQLVVGGRTSPSSEDIIESLKVLIEYGADVNYVPPSSSDARALLRDPVPYLAAIHTEPEVVKFLFEKGADFTVRHPHMDQRTVLNQCSFMNAFTIQKLLDPAAVQHSMSFKQSNYPARYKHELAVMKLDWVHFIGESQLQSTLVNMLQSRVISAFKVEPEDRTQTYASHQKTEISFELQLNSSEPTMTPVTLVYESDISCNGSEDFDLTVTIPRDQGSSEQIAVKFRYDLNAFHGNDLIPDLHKEHYEEFEQCLAELMHVKSSTDLGYLFVLMLLCHVDDETLVHKKGWRSNRSRVLRPSILGALPVPPIVAQLGRDWAHSQNIESGY
jgi:hypothetical protein